MVTIAEDCPASWWRQRSDSEDTEDTQDTSKTSAASSQARLVQCELVQIQSPSVTPARGYQGAFHQITRHRRGSMQSEAFSEPVFQKQGKLVTFFRGFVLPRTLVGKSRRKKVFQVDLAEHLFSVGIYVPQVVSVCCNFIEVRGLVDGVYRLSGISSNIQRLKKTFDEDKIPNLAKDRLVLQDIHSVSSLVKLYFRELPVPVCTFNLYDDFVSAVRSPEEGRILKLREVITQLPDPNYNTLEFLLKHLHRVSLHHKDTGMTAKNLAIVWAPNLLRSPALEAGGVEALQGVAVQAVVTEYLIKYCHLLFTSPSSTSTTPRTSRQQPAAPSPASFPISSPIKLLSLAEAQEQYHNRRNHLHSLTLNTRKKAKHWSKKTFFSKKREDLISGGGDTSSVSLCPCFSGGSSAPADSCCRCVRRLEPDSEAELETRTLARRGDTADQSPVILRCLRRGVADTDSGSGHFNKRSSLRDKFRKFALSPISSSHNIIEKLDEAKHSLAGQHVNQKILHLNESLEFIDASSEDEELTDSELSPSVKRSKITVNRLSEICDQKARAAARTTRVIAAPVKESKIEKCAITNHEGDKAASAKLNTDTTQTQHSGKVTSTSADKITSNQITPHLKSFPPSATDSAEDQHAPKTQNKERELPSTEITVANVTKDSSSTEPVSASKDDKETSEKM